MYKQNPMLKNGSNFLRDDSAKSDESKNILTLDARIGTIFLTLGISVKIKGYRYLREAVKLVYEDPCRIDNLTRDVYAFLAETYSERTANIERAMGYAITASCDSDKFYGINKYLGAVIYKKPEKPYAGEFIALIAEILRCEENK